MVDAAALRIKMVDGQVRPNDVTDHRIIEAMLTVPREAFVPAGRKDRAYLDRDLPVGEAEGSRCLIQPMILSRLIQAAAVTSTDKVLEVGAATGYGSAVLSSLAGSVVALEEDAALAAAAGKALGDYGNVSVAVGSLAAGAADKAPFDVILFNGSVEVFPETIAAQLAEGGRLLLVMGRGNAARAMIYTQSHGDISGRVLFNASVPLLPGFAAEQAFVF